MDKSKIIRKFERYVFQGVPERPEATFERDEFSSHTIRHTGKSNTSGLNVIDDDLGETIILGFIKDDFENQVESFHPIGEIETTE